MALVRMALLRNVPRRFSAHHGAAIQSGLDSNGLVIQPRESPKLLPSKEELLGNFGKFFSDNLLVCDWAKDEGWGVPKIQAMQKLHISPASSALHYALQCFEGMKAYRKSATEILLFRPELNAARLNASLRRLAMPEVDESEFIKLLAKFVEHEARWIPDGDGYSAYLRPTVISTDSSLGVGVTSSCKFFTLLSPVGPYYASAFQPITVFADSRNIRAWPGGSGSNKVGANYAPTILPQKSAFDAFGAQQVLYCPEGRLTEIGSMNFFAVVGDELWTPTLSRGEILPGVTRQSILELAPKLGVRALEVDITLEDLQNASQRGLLREIFGCGTAAVICPVAKVLLGDQVSIDVPVRSDGIGPLAKAIWTKLTDIQYGRDPAYSHWTWPIALA